MGFTLAAALRALGADSEVAVAELIPYAPWNRGPLTHLAGHPLQDVRARMREADVADILREAPCVYDAILLDVDNGPNGLTRKENDWLYGLSGLKAAQTALCPGGMVGGRGRCIYQATRENRIRCRGEARARAACDLAGDAGGLTATAALATRRFSPTLAVVSPPSIYSILFRLLKTFTPSTLHSAKAQAAAAANMAATKIFCDMAAPKSMWGCRRYARGRGGQCTERLRRGYAR